MKKKNSKYRKIDYRLISVLIFIVICSNIYARGNNKFTFWNLNYVRGFVGLESNYYYQNTNLKTGFAEEQNSSQFNGSFSLDTKGYILHPNFLELELNALFRPGTRHDNFIVVPDQASVTTSERVAFRTNIFNQRPLSGSFYINYDHSYVRRDFATNIDNIKKNVGAYLNLRTSLANFNINYNYDDWLQDELDLKRLYFSKIHNLRGHISQSFGKNYDNQLTLNYADYSRKYSSNNLFIANKTFDGNLKTKVNFNILTPTRYFSLISYNNQVGYDRRKKFDILQSFSTELPYNFNLNAGYNYNYLKVDLFSSDINRANLRFNHQLFSSLSSFISYEFTNYKQTSFSELTNDFQIGFDYSKIIPYGNIRLSYSYGRYKKSSESSTNINSVYGEVHQLTEGNIELLNNPNVIKNSLVVTDEQNVIIYQEGFDYQIVEQGDFLEIRKLAGGQISNDGVVLVNYDFLWNNTFKYVSPNQKFFVGINLFNDFIQLAYSGIEINYNNLGNIQNIVLQYISQRIYSVRLNYVGFTAGVEFDSFESNIVPYESVRYFGQYDHFFGKTALLSLIVNYKSLYLTGQDETQNFMDVVGRVMVFLSQKSKIMFEGSYRFQDGVGIDLDLLRFKSEYQINFRATEVAVGLELFDRNYIHESRQYLNGYISLQRNF